MLNEETKVREKAKLLVEYIYIQTVNTLPPLSFGCDSALKETYEVASTILSANLARKFAPEAYNLVTECARCSAGVLKGAEAESMLGYLMPWVEKMDFSVMTPIKSEALNNLIFLTHMYHSECRRQIIFMWDSLVKKPYNIGPIISRLLDLSLEKGPDFVALAKLICMYLVNASPKATVDRLVGELVVLICEKKEIPFPEAPDLPITSSSEDLNVKSDSSSLLDTVLPTLSCNGSFSRSYFLLSIISEISYCNNSYTQQILCYILHICFFMIIVILYSIW